MERAFEIFDRYVGVAEYAKIQPNFEKDGNTRVVLGLLGMAIVLGGFVGGICMAGEPEGILVMLGGFIGGGYLINYACNYSSLPEEVVKNYRQKEVNLINYLAERLDDIKAHHLYRKHSNTSEFKNWLDTYADILSKSLGIEQVILFSKNLFEMKITRPHLDYYKSRCANVLIAEMVSILQVSNTKKTTKQEYLDDYSKETNHHHNEHKGELSEYSKNIFCAFFCTIISLGVLWGGITVVKNDGEAKVDTLHTQSIIVNDSVKITQFGKIRGTDSKPTVVNTKTQNAQVPVIRKDAEQSSQANREKEAVQSANASTNIDNSDSKYDYNDCDVENLGLMTCMFGVREDRLLITDRTAVKRWERAHRSWIGNIWYDMSHLNDDTKFTAVFVIGLCCVIFVVVFLFLDWCSCEKERKEYERTHKVSKIRKTTW